MQSVGEYQDATFGEIRDLERAILEKCGEPDSRDRSLPADLETRRNDLLCMHLGFRPRAPLPRLHVIGDSHSAFFAGAEGIRFYPGRRIYTGFLRVRHVSAFIELLPVFRVFHVGSATAWQAAEPTSSTYTRKKIDALLRRDDIPKGATVLLVFGEIDCRCHIPRAVLGGVSIDNAIAMTVSRFLRLADHIQSAGRTPAIWLPSITPTLPPSEKPEAMPLPVIGTQHLRDEITARYCENLSRAASAAGLRCAGLEPPPFGTPPPSEWFWDAHHLSQRLMPPALKSLTSAGILSFDASRPNS